VARNSTSSVPRRIATARFAFFGSGTGLDSAPWTSGSTTVYFAPESPKGVARGNWIQTDPSKGYFIILRLYSPLPAFFDKSWQIGEVELVD